MRADVSAGIVTMGGCADILWLGLASEEISGHLGVTGRLGHTQVHLKKLYAGYAAMPARLIVMDRLEMHRQNTYRDCCPRAMHIKLHHKPAADRTFLARQHASRLPVSCQHARLPTGSAAEAN